jgi:nucleotide-binding universal stress UspA family protein
MGPIVCGTDFSDWARGAQSTAAVLAARSGRELVLVHVVEADVDHLSSEARTQAMATITARLDAEARALTPLAKTTVRAELLHGRTAAVLRAYAHGQHASLLVVGSAGHGTTSLARLGGTSERLASTNEVPVLVVRDPEAFLGWASQRPVRVLLGIDESEASASAVRWVEHLRALAPVDVVIGRVYYPDEAQRRYGLSRHGSYTSPDPALEALIERDLKRGVPRLAGLGEVSFRARLGVGRVADHLIELAEAERCDLVVVGTHGRAGLARMWSVSAAALHLARMAVCVVPPDGEQPTPAPAPPQLKRVLVTTDFSPLGDSAIAWAYTLAPAGAEVTLTHVVLLDALTGQVRESSGGQAQTRAGLETAVASRLRALTPPFADARDVVTRTEVLRSSEPAKAICEAAERLGIDALVIASHGRTGVVRAVLGSVAEEVVRLSHRPVFIVRGPS